MSEKLKPCVNDKCIMNIKNGNGCALLSKKIYGLNDCRDYITEKQPDYKKILEKLKSKLMEDIRCENDDYDNGYKDACDETLEYMEELEKELEG
jgi:hypothetical protein